jgi:hypothetical protein
MMTFARFKEMYASPRCRFVEVKSSKKAKEILAESRIGFCGYGNTGWSQLSSHWNKGNVTRYVCRDSLLIEKSHGIPQPPIKLPPSYFTNAMHELFPGFDYSDWENSPQWGLWNAGRESACRDLEQDARTAAAPAREVRERIGRSIYDNRKRT